MRRGVPKDHEYDETGQCKWCEHKDQSKASFAAPAGSGEAALVSELRSLAATEYPLCPEARLLLEMAVDAQLGKPIDVTRLLPNEKAQPRPKHEKGTK